MSKVRVLMVGDHPSLFSGNGHMMRALLLLMDKSIFEVECFGVYPPSVENYLNSFHGVEGVSIHNIESPNYDPQRLYYLLSKRSFDIVVFVGIDVWRYGQIHRNLEQFKSKTKFVCIAPYDSPYLREDWVQMFSFFDAPFVYSQYGYGKLKDKVPNIKYFRPPLDNANIFRPLEPEKRTRAREELLGIRDDSVFLFGFVGKNQFRKEPLKLIKAFSVVKKHRPKTTLYMHTNADGVFDLDYTIKNSGLRKGDVLINNQHNQNWSDYEMSILYGVFDCFVSCSMQEGLNWPLLQSLLCGVSIVATDTTANTELVKGVGELVPCSEMTYIPSFGYQGEVAVESIGCNYEQLAKAMVDVVDFCVNGENIPTKDDVIKKGKDWLDGVSDINNTLMGVYEEAIAIKNTPKKKDILFVQHSSAGDVLMSTQCFKGIKERHPKLELHYMTQYMYMDIITENPYIDNIIDWDEDLINKYEIVYNPHGERILPGGFNNLDVTLHSMYPYFCKVEPDDITIVPSVYNDAELEALLKITGHPMVVFHSTGGQQQYRTYKHFNIVLRNQKWVTVQIGAQEDFPVRGVDVDLRGQLSFRQTAHIISRANVFVGVDSFPMHLAAALGVDTVSVFGPAPARVTQPKAQHGAKVICLEPNKLDVCPSLTSCWGQPGNKVCETPCINTVNPHKVRKAIKELLGEN